MLHRDGPIYAFKNAFMNKNILKDGQIKGMYRIDRFTGFVDP